MNITMPGPEKSQAVTRQKLFFISLCLMIISFPVSIAVNSMLIGILFIFFLSDYKHLKTNWMVFISQKQNLILCVLFISLIISLFQTKDLGKGFDRVIHSAAMIGLPLAMTQLKTFDEVSLRLLKRLHIIVCVLASVYCLVSVMVNSGLIDGTYVEHVGTGDRLTYLVKQFTYHNLSSNIHLHAVYFSFFIAMAMFFTMIEFNSEVGVIKSMAFIVFGFLAIILFLLTSVVINFAFYSFLMFYLYMTLSFRKRFHHLIFYAFAVLFSLIILYQFILKYTSSYTSNIYFFQDPGINRYFLIVPVACFLAAICAVLMKLYFPYRRIAIGFLLIIAGGLVFVPVYKNFQNRNYVEKEKGVGVNNINARNGNWKGAWMVIQEHPVTGVGMGDEMAALIEKYKEINFTTGVQNGFNAHNQYLEYWVSSGLIAFLSFVLLIVYLLYYGYVNRNFSLLCLVYIFAVFCMTESTMSRQPGRVFFLFFLCLLSYDKWPSNKPEYKSSLTR